MPPFLFDFLIITIHAITMNDTKSKEKYYAYLQTDTWKQIRDRVVKRDMGRCRVCNSPKLLNVHHRKYPAVYGEELLIDLITLCEKCHELFHFGSIKSPTRNKKVFKAKGNNSILRKAKSKLLDEGISANGNIQRVAKLICNNKGMIYPKKGKRNKANCLEIIKEYLNKPTDYSIHKVPTEIPLKQSILRKKSEVPPQ